MERVRPIVLLTDFGADGFYQGVMKGVILGIHPGARIIDLTHGIRPGAVEEAGHVLESSYRFFPEGSVFACVVDPGVGGPRRAILAELRLYTFLAPDNGLLAPILAREAGARVREIRETAFHLATRSSTFHGRDVFAPVAAHLAAGLAPREVGPAVDDALRPARPDVTLDDDGLHGVVIHVDPFGNLITNVRREVLTPLFSRGPFEIRCGDATIRQVVRTYGDGNPGEILALISSSDHLEIAMRGGRADAALAAGPGTPVHVRFVPGREGRRA